MTAAHTTCTQRVIDCAPLPVSQSYPLGRHLIEGVSIHWFRCPLLGSQLGAAVACISRPQETHVTDHRVLAYGRVESPGLRYCNQELRIGAAELTVHFRVCGADSSLNLDLFLLERDVFDQCSKESAPAFRVERVQPFG